MKLLLGIDQGSTKTHAVIAAPNGEILGMGHAPGSLHTVYGMEAALNAMDEACDMALAQAGAKREEIEWVSGGITGIDYPYEKVLLTETLAAHYNASGVYVHNDCIGALWGGTFDTPAVVCCAGTGLNVGGANERGEVDQFGNYCNGIYQGGGSIGQNALQAVFDAHIGKAPKTVLSQKFMDFAGAADVDELLLLRYRKKTVNPSKLCPLVFEAAGEGDPVAIELLETVAGHWGAFILCMMDRLGLDRAAPVNVVLSGSVFKGRPAIPQQVIAKILAEHAPKAVMLEAVYEPVVGAAAMGLQHIGEEGWKQRLAESAQKLKLLRGRKDG